MAFPAIVALVAAETVTATVVLAAVTEVGVALTVVGAVTGSKDLMKIGGVMSLVGGIGGMVAGASAGGAAAATGEGLSEAATNSALESASTEAINASALPAGGMTDEMAIAQMGGAPAPGIVQGGQVAQAAQAPAAQVAAQAPAQSAAQAVPEVQAASPTVNDVAGAQAPSGPAGVTDVATPYSNPTDMRLAAGTQTSPLAPQTSDSFFSKFSAFAEKNKTLLNTGTQLIGGALKGANEADMWGQKMGLARDQFNRANSAGTFAPRAIVGGA